MERQCFDWSQAIEYGEQLALLAVVVPTMRLASLERLNDDTQDLALDWNRSRSRGRG